LANTFAVQQCVTIHDSYAEQQKLVLTVVTVTSQHYVSVQN